MIPDAIGEVGASILLFVCYIAMFGAAMWLAVRTLDLIVRRELSDNKSCLAMGALFALYMALLIILFGPAIGAIASYSCRSADDYAACMGDD